MSRQARAEVAGPAQRAVGAKGVGARAQGLAADGVGGPAQGLTADGVGGPAQGLGAEAAGGRVQGLTAEAGGGPAQGLGAEAAGGRVQGLTAEAGGGSAQGLAAEAAGGRVQRLAGAVLHGGGLLLAAPLWVWWALDGGGYLSPAWITGLVVLALATSVTLLLVPGAGASHGWGAVAAGALFAYAAISALSMLVASDRGQAWLWSERALLYALAFALPLLWPPSLRAVKAGLVLWIAAALAALGVGLLRARHGVLVDGRLSDPTTYPNATAALLLMGAMPGVMLAALPRSTIAQRALGLAAAGALAGGAVLTQSRGILIVGALAGVGAVLVTPARLRLAAAGACVLAALAWQRHALLDLHQLAAGGDPAGGVARAIVAVGAIAATLAVAGAAWALVERRVTVPTPTPGWRRGMRRAGSLAAVAAAVAVALLVTDGRPMSWADAHLRDFKTPDYQRVETSDSRFSGGLGSNRYDYWRVAVGASLREPLRGSGAGSFVQTYFAQRRTLRAPVYAHQLWLGTAAELGLPGLAALLAFVVAFAVALRSRLRGLASADAALLLAAAAPLAVLLMHSSADWSFSFPGLAVPALGLAGAAIAAPGAPARQARHVGLAGAAARRARHLRLPQAAIAAPGAAPRRLLRSRGARVAAAVLVAALAATAVPLAVAEQLVQRAEAREASDPAAARADLRRAQRWAPLSGRPPLVLGLLELRRRDTSAARRAFAEAHARDRAAWFPLLELALLTPSDQRAQALRLAQRAAAANPRDRLIAAVLRALSHNRSVSARGIALQALGTPG